MLYDALNQLVSETSVIKQFLSHTKHLAWEI